MSSVADLVRGLGVLSEAPEPEHAGVAEALGLDDGPPSGEEYVEVLLHQAYPYASVYLGAEGLLGGEARDRVAGFWRAVGLVPPPEPDHLAALLGLYATLVEGEADEPDAARAALRRSSRRALLWEHLLSWCPVYLDKVVAIGSARYHAWADLLSQTLLGEARSLGPQERLPLALRLADGLPPSGAAASDWVAALLAPSRTGLIVTRADLARCARALDLGLRLGERAYILRALLEQDANATLTWLAAEADAAAVRYGSLPPELGDVRAFWQGRAEGTSGALRATLAAGLT